MNGKTICLTILALVLSSAVFFVGYNEVKVPKTVYKVYLDGETIGLINSKDELESYIDQEQDEIKDKYGVDKVYLPNNLDIEKETTYSNKINTVEEIYEKVKDIAPFTINGYEIKIKGVEEVSSDESIETTKTVKIYTLDKDIFTEAVETTIKAFIEEKDYDEFKQGNQKEIDNIGRKIENIYIQNNITIKKTNISVEEQIFTNSEELSQYLLFGTLDKQENYSVKAGETVEDIAFNNKMSTNEFLVANPNIPSADVLLTAGEVVNIGAIDPAFKVMEEEYVVEYQTIDYGTTYEYDASLPKGTERVKQNGVDGQAKVSYRVKKANGEIISTDPESTETIKSAQNRIVIRGTKVVSSVGVSVGGVWFWPTEKPYTINSPYGYRWGKLHEGTDIGGKRNSNIYAANNGVVAESGYNKTNGNYIYIDHKNGYYTTYSHLNARLVKKGDVVEMGQVIGKMGMTGNATGVHLHFSLWRGYPHYGGKSLNAMRSLKFK